MERKQVKGNTWYLTGRQLIPVYRINETDCILFDPGRADEREAIETTLQEAGWRPVGVMLSHMHYDHHENTKYFQQKYGIPAAMPQGDADICRSAATLKNHLFVFTMGMIETTPRLQNLITPIQRPIAWDETQITFQGASFSVLHTPGHSPDHACYITPDHVCFVGDVLMGGEDLAQAKIPFVFDVKLDLASKELLRPLHCDAYILSHQEVFTGPLPDLIDANTALILKRLQLMQDLITVPMPYTEVYHLVLDALGFGQVHPARAMHLERYLRPYVEYLIDQNRVELVTVHGVPGVAPRKG